MVSQVISVLALSGMALAASYSNSTTNGTIASGTASVVNSTSSTSSAAVSGATTTPYSNGTIISDENAFCAFYSNSSNGYSVGGVTYVIECGANFGGVVIDLDLTITLSKRQVAAEPGLPTCINNCNLITEDAASTGGADCVATSFNRDTDACTYYSLITGPIANPGDAVDFALVADNNAAGTGAAGGAAGTAVPLTTSTVAAVTSTYTIYSCAATVTDCPYRQVATTVIPAYTTVCPGNSAATSALAAPVACTACPYSAKVITVYSATTVAGSTSYVAVDTKVMNIPTPTGSGSLSTGLTTTICTGCAATATASGVVAYTGAAHHIEAGMGMAALVGAAALLI